VEVIAIRSIQERTTNKIVDLLFKLISDIPSPAHPEKASAPLLRARRLVRVNAAFAASISAGLSVPPGPLGVISVLPDLATVWRVQQKMVVDIAAAYGKSATLTREQMLYCLFQHTAAQTVRLLVVNTGERILIREASLEVIQRILRKIGLRISQRTMSRALERWIPLAGAMAVGYYSFRSTRKVGESAIRLFGQDDSPVQPVEIVDERIDRLDSGEVTLLPAPDGEEDGAV